jgi:hypothetical protein
LINLLSLGPLLQAAPAVSTDSSASASPDFSALLTELVGAIPQQTPVPNFPTGLDGLQSTPSASNTGPAQKPKSTIQDGSAQLAQPGTGVPALAFGPTIPFSLPASPQASSQPTKPEEVSSTVPGAPADNKPPAAPTLPQLPQPFLDALEKAGVKVEPPASKATEAQPVSSPNQALASTVALEHLLEGSAAPPNSASEPNDDQGDGKVHLPLGDIKKFEITIQHEAGPATVQPAMLPKQVAISTDPLVSIRQQQLPPRVTAIQKVVMEGKPSNRKTEGAPDSGDQNTPVPSLQSTDPERTTDPVEQPRPPQHVQIPDVPKLQVVRTVSMEVGDADSQVTIRIEDRDGGMRLHIGAGSDTMHRTLESSVDSLVQSLKQEKIELSNVQISRKSPIEKVRRMKEAH